MNKNTVYILQKDALTVVWSQSFVIPKGSEFHYMRDAGRYVCKENWCWYDEKFVENNTEWFKPKEQVNESKPTEQPQWEILYFEDLKYGDRKNYIPNNKSIEPHLLKYSSQYKIRTVKRLPDNTVWSVDMMTEHGKISAFRILGGIMIADITDSPYPLNFLYLSQLKAPKEEQVPIKVSHITSHDAIDFRDKTVYSHGVWVSQPIPESKYQSIKEAIEGVLNDESSDKKYTESELLQARRDAFDAARGVVGYSDALKNSPVTVGRKYKDNEDYINSLNK